MDELNHDLQLLALFPAVVERHPFKVCWSDAYTYENQRYYTVQLGSLHAAKTRAQITAYFGQFRPGSFS